MNELKLNTPLSLNDVEFRAQSVNNGGYITILAYKNARVDMDRLDAVFTPFGWKREHQFINGKEFCTVSIYDKNTNQWVSKQDCGTESMAEKQKGETSDAFKRACFNWGIGRELYKYPIIQVKLFENEYNPTTKKTTFAFQLKNWKWHAEFSEDGKIQRLASKDQNGKLRFDWKCEGYINKQQNK